LLIIFIRIYIICIYNHNHPHRNRSTINHSTRVNDNKKGISLENKRLYRHYFSNSIDENPDNNNKNKENHSYFQKTDIKIKKEEMREEHKRENIINKKINLMLYEDSSNLRKINVVTPKNDNKKIEESNAKKKENNMLSPVQIRNIEQSQRENKRRLFLSECIKID